MNSCLVRYNLLAGIEDLGIVDCNKYFVSFKTIRLHECFFYLICVKHGCMHMKNSVAAASAASATNTNTTTTLSITKYFFSLTYGQLHFFYYEIGPCLVRILDNRV